MATILLTGFEPFGGEEANPSWNAVRAVRDSWSGPGTVHAVELPVDFRGLDAVLLDAFERYQPDVVICTGLAGGNADIAVERIAINVKDPGVPDNAGYLPVDEPVDEDGPAAYFSTLPIKPIVARLAEDGIPARVSDSAGTYTCNYVFYRLMRALAELRPHAIGGFVHVPYELAQAVGSVRPRPSMSHETITRAIALAATTALESLEQRLDTAVGLT
ncbi:pyroglutamyl-peptidase I [Umezawaea tangerina]|uniref:Pyrrolidone-carboxylate peptidase n=1 Tax=Umezawaea tangerina TaxID=84725 RepID=A0A2T0T242_9PSEU|nr:pyroglutamyl-peptidase I [Umezawaea tangerina]PRY39727.1 pyroglutamyl-peptidase [Umezawaea tangerina]